MLFNTLGFAIFFSVVYAVYLVLPFRAQNLWLLVSSYCFYASWDYRFAGLLLLSTTIAYLCSLVVHSARPAGRKRLYLTLSIVADLGILCYFKYWHFFATSLSLPSLASTVILPVGISFYTFHSIGYVVDVYRGTTEPPRRFTDYAIFVSFFPLLVSGPIERSTNLLPQILKPRSVSFDRIQRGFFLVLFGLFQKIVLADNLSLFVDWIFAGQSYRGAEVFAAVYCFAFQIYCDFAGYTNIARGVAEFMGFELMSNFNHPYFSASPTEFWRRWHISLSSWLRDYLYKPLGGSRSGTLATCRNLMITMLLGGLWHGANWTFVLWGFYHGLLLILHKILSPRLARFTGFVPRLVSIFVTFNLVCLGWLFFRATSLTQAFAMLEALARTSDWLPAGVGAVFAGVSVWIVVFLILEFAEWLVDRNFSELGFGRVVTVLIAFVMFYSALLFGVTDARTFLYFQF